MDEGLKEYCFMLRRSYGWGEEAYDMAGVSALLIEAFVTFNSMDWVGVMHKYMDKDIDNEIISIKH